MVDLGEPLAAGRTADIYRWGEAKVVKLYQPWMSLEAVESERRKTSAAQTLGISVPAVGDIVHVKDRVGLVFERIDGPSMMDLLTLHQDAVPSSARQLAELQATFHAAGSPLELPDQSETLANRISDSELLSPEMRARALEALARMPVEGKLCHGDFHPGNIMLSDRGPVIIDWIDATRGHPMADIARTSLLFLGHLETSDEADAAKSAIELFHKAYLAWHLVQDPTRRDQYQSWFPIVAAARLAEGIAEQEDWLLVQVHVGLGGES